MHQWQAKTGCITWDGVAKAADDAMLLSMQHKMESLCSLTACSQQIGSVTILRPLSACKAGINISFSMFAVIWLQRPQPRQQQSHQRPFWHSKADSARPQIPRGCASGGLYTHHLHVWRRALQQSGALARLIITLTALLPSLELIF